MEDKVILKTSVSAGLLKHTLFKGIAIALPGILGLILAGVYLPPSQLSKWGFLLFALGIGLITLGLLPYRKLSRLQLKPNEIHLLASDEFDLYMKGNKLLTVPFDTIKKIEFIQDGKFYGIAFWWKHPPPARIIIHQQSKEINRMRTLALTYGGSDFFIPYFNQRAFQELKDFLGDY